MMPFILNNFIQTFYTSIYIYIIPNKSGESVVTPFKNQPTVLLLKTHWIIRNNTESKNSVDILKIAAGEFV